jgi:multicomponent Na+:H+ antiporter subunit F
VSAVHDAVVAAALVWSLLLVLGFLAAALRGRSLLDRALAIDGLGLCLVAVLVLLAVRHHEAAYLDAALALALLAFLGTLAVARFGGGGGAPEEPR